MASGRPPKRLFKAQEHVSRYVVDRTSRSRLKRVTRDYQDVLQVIETTIVHHDRRDPGLDDRLIDAALTALILDNRAADSAALDLARAIADSRPSGTRVTDPVWKECLRVVQESVRRHSPLRPGVVTYLKFINEHIQ